MRRFMAAVLAVLMMLCVFPAIAEETYDGSMIAFSVGNTQVTASELEAETRLYLFMAALECAEYEEDYDIMDPENIDDRAYLAVMDMEERIANRILMEQEGIPPLSAEDEEAILESAREEWERYRGIAWSDSGIAFLPAGNYQVVDGDPEGNITRYFAGFGLTEETLAGIVREEMISSRIRQSVFDTLADMTTDQKIDYYVQWQKDKMDEIGVTENQEVIALVRDRLAEDPSETAGDDFDAFDRTVMINGTYYELGTDTLQSFAAAGWTWTQESDGVYAFEVPETGSWFYVRTENDDPETPVVMVDLMWADGLEAEYLGIDVSTEGDEGTSLWDYLEEYYDAEINEEGTLQAVYGMPDGRTVLIETTGRTIRLTLMAE